jgi:hypothetical protein
MAALGLVHGAYQGGWVHARTACLLREAGHDVYTPTRTGHGERSHLAHHAISLDTHIQDIVSVFKHEMSIRPNVAGDMIAIWTAGVREPTIPGWVHNVDGWQPISQ